MADSYINILEKLRAYCETEKCLPPDGTPYLQAAQATIDARDALREASCMIDLVCRCETCVHADCPRDAGECEDCVNQGGGYEGWKWRWPIHPLRGNSFTEVINGGIENIKNLEEAKVVLHGECAVCKYEDSGAYAQPCKSCKFNPPSYCYGTLNYHNGSLDNWTWKWPLCKPVTINDLMVRVGSGFTLACTIGMAQELRIIREELHGECTACKYLEEDEDSKRCALCDDGSNWVWRWHHENG